MRVCFVSHDSDMIGAERAMLELIVGLRRKDVECFVLLPRSGPMTQFLERERIPFAIIPYQWWVHEGEWRATLYRNLANFRMVAPVARQLDRWQIEVVWTNSGAAPPVGAFAAKSRALPHVWALHEFVRKEHGISYPLGTSFSCKVISGLSSRVVVCSKTLEDYYSRYIPEQKLRVAYCGVSFSCDPAEEARRLLETGRQLPKLLVVGVVQEGKRQRDAILALGHLAREGIRAELFLVGWAVPSYEERLRRLIAENGVEDAVHFCGYVEDAAALMKDADLVLSCSMWEGFSRVTVEAMKAGKPIVAARHGGTAELVRDGFNGLLFTPSDATSLGEKIRRLIENPELARQLGNNGREWAESEFSMEKYADRVAGILSEVAAK